MRSLFLLFVVFIIGCDTSVSDNEKVSENSRIAKWYNNHTSAITLTHDNPASFSSVNKELQNILELHSLTMDYELVTNRSDPYSISPHGVAYLRDTLNSLGFGYFGHGDKHDDHDGLSYFEAYQSFKACYDSMSLWGLEPIAYAYPYGAGRKKKTQQALKDAGFLSGRAFTSDNEQVPSFHIMAGDKSIPNNWFLLPTLRMESIDFNNNDNMINDDQELCGYLDESLELGSWLILTYHALASDGWGYTTKKDFIENVVSISQRDFWNASLNEITLYTYERASCSVEIDSSYTDTLRVKLTDAYSDNQKFSQPLTVILTAMQPHTEYLLTQGEFTTTLLSQNDTLLANLLPNEQWYTITLK